MKQKRFLSLCLILLASSLLLAACSSAGNDYGAMATADNAARGEIYWEASAAPASSMAVAGAAPEAAMDDMAASPELPAEAVNAPTGGEGGILPDTVARPEETQRKIITTYDLTVETTQFDASVDFVNSIVEEFGGYIENSSVQGRSIQYEDNSLRMAHFTLRIPTGSVGQFVALVGERYNVIHTQESARDITDSYYDVQARLRSLEDQEKQLNGLLEQGGDLQYILEVHRELANVRYQIEDFYSSLQRMDQSVNFSTANITLQEVISYQPVNAEPPGFGERVGQAAARSWVNFTRSAQNSFVGFVYALPFLLGNLLVIAVLAVIVLVARRIIRKRRGLKRGEPTFGWLYRGAPRQGAAITPAPPADEKPADPPEEKRGRD
jgi:hypothetical protein